MLTGHSGMSHLHGGRESPTSPISSCNDPNQRRHPFARCRTLSQARANASPGDTDDAAPAAGLLSTASYRSLVSATNGHSAPLSATAIADEDTVELVLSPADRARLAALLNPVMIKPLVESAKPREPEVIWDLAPLDGLTVQPSLAAIPKPVQARGFPRVPAPVAPAVVAAEIPQAEFSVATASLAPFGAHRFSRRLRLGCRKRRSKKRNRCHRAGDRSPSFAGHCRAAITASDLPLAGRHANRRSAISRRWRPAAGVSEPTCGSPSESAEAWPSFRRRSISRCIALRNSARFGAVRRRAGARCHSRAPSIPLKNPPRHCCCPRPRKSLPRPRLPRTMVALAQACLHSPSACQRRRRGALGRATAAHAGRSLPSAAASKFYRKPKLEPAAWRASALAAPTWMVSVLVAMLLFLGRGQPAPIPHRQSGYQRGRRGSRIAAGQRIRSVARRSSLPRNIPARDSSKWPASAWSPPPNKRPQLQYIVVNHSAGELTGLNIHIAVHSADSPTGAPLFTVTSAIASLAANQSKEIRTDIDPGIKPASIPDWQSLRTDVLIARQ